MSLQIRRGTNSSRLSANPPLGLGEIAYTTDTKQIYVGNGIDQGGEPIIRLGTGLAWADAQCTTIIATGAALQVSADPTPSLGGNLSLNSHTINGTGNINITGSVLANGIGCSALVTDTISTTDTNLNGLEIFTKHDNGLDLCVYNGNRLAQTTMLPGDNLGQVAFKSYNGTDYNSVSVGLNASLDATATVTDNLPKSLFRIFVGAGGSNAAIASFNHTGVFSAPTFSAGDGSAANPSLTFTTDGSVDSGFFHPGDGVICASTDGIERVRIDNGGMRVSGFMKVADVAGNLPNPPEAGMIVLDGSTFKGYNGSAWVNLN